MVSSQIQYAMNPLGQAIAYLAAGDGPAIVVCPGMGTTIDLVRYESDVAEALSTTYASLEARHSVVRYDNRGYGMSDRDSHATSVAELVADLVTVLDAVDRDPVTLLGVSHGGQAAISLAAEHPERISHLVLVGAFAEFNERERATALSMAEMFRANWGIASRALGELFAADQPDVDVDQLAERQRKAAEPEAVAAMLVMNSRSSVKILLGAIKAKTLILHSREDHVVPFHHATEMAAAIPHAQLLPLSGSHLVLSSHDRELAVEAILGFLQDGTTDGASMAAGLQTILFTDLEASTPLTQRLGDEGAQEILRGHNASVRGALEEHGGREVKHTGDGIMASFPSAVAAVTAALQIQRELAGGEVRVRVGLNAGEPIAEDEDLFGLSVIKAARVADRAEPGQVLVSRVVRELCEGKTFQFSSLGEVSLKGFNEAVELFEVVG